MPTSKDVSRMYWASTANGSTVLDSLPLLVMDALDVDDEEELADDEEEELEPATWVRSVSSALAAATTSSSWAYKHSRHINELTQLGKYVL